MGDLLTGRPKASLSTLNPSRDLQPSSDSHSASLLRNACPVALARCMVCFLRLRVAIRGISHGTAALWLDASGTSMVKQRLSNNDAIDRAISMGTAMTAEGIAQADRVCFAGAIRRIEHRVSSLPRRADSALPYALRCFPHASPTTDAVSGKHSGALEAAAKTLILFRKNGAGEGIRTLDPDLGKVVLYP